MSGVATAIVGGAVIGAAITSNASKKAAATQAASADRAADLQWQQYQQTREDQAPWREAGAWGIGRLRDLMGEGGELTKKFTYNDFYADPGYSFRLNEGMKAVQRSAAAKGGLLSGGTLKGLTDYSQGMASQEYGAAYGRWNNDQTNTFNRLASIAQLGQTANQATGAAGSNAANSIGNLWTQSAAAQAAGTVGQANAWTSGINNATNAWMQYNMLSKLNAGK